MNLDYLQNVLIPQREKEIKEGKNLATSQPIYVVLSLIENVISGRHTDYSFHNTNYKSKLEEYGYIDLEKYCEEREFKTSNKGMKKPEAVTRFYTDRIEAFFLTSKEAHAYCKYQAHNLNEPYVYVFHSGYANSEMDQLLNGM